MPLLLSTHTTSRCNTDVGIQPPRCMTGWRLAFDRGGTFTDWLLFNHAGNNLASGKFPSRLPDGSEAPFPWNEVAAALQLSSLQQLLAGEVRFASTIATNLLLEGRGEQPLLLITAGFGDLLLLGDGTRPELFQPWVHPPKPLTHRVLEVEERMLPEGDVERQLDEEGLRKALAGSLQKGGIVVISFVHSVENPAHEILAGRIAGELGAGHVILSHRLHPRQGLLRRTERVVLEGRLLPDTRAALDAFSADLADESDALCLRSDGSLAPIDEVAASELLLSGPAGGLIAVGEIAHRHRLAEAVGLDMGGTSTDVCRWDGSTSLAEDRMLAGRRIPVPQLPIHSIASGGGSILQIEGGRPRVGPQSAGAVPGPASYGCSGPPTLTDALVVLGRLPPEALPFCFGPDADRPLDYKPASIALQSLLAALDSTDEEQDSEAGMLNLAEGFLDVAVAQMVQAMRQVTVAEGYDVREHALIAFGGAGPQFACKLAEMLDIRMVIVPSDAGILSARGVAVATRSERRERTVHLGWDKSALQQAEQGLKELAAQASEALKHGSVSLEQLFSVGVRQRGREDVVFLDWAGLDELESAFRTRHSRTHGYVPERLELEFVLLRVTCKRPSMKGQPTPPRRVVSSSMKEEESAQVWIDGEWWTVPLLADDALPTGTRFDGPMMISTPTHMLWIESGWQGDLDEHGDWVLRLTSTPSMRSVTAKSVEEWNKEPLSLEVLSQHLDGITAEMGETLRRTARSVNVARRRDYSCALFDAGGQLVANTSHIPVHLGAMSASIEALLSTFVNPGEAKNESGLGNAWPAALVLATNDPTQGGSHLPDVTVVTPVHDHSGRLICLCGNRAHHADIGGSTPGSMSPSASSASEEGVCFHALPVVLNGQFQRQNIAEVLSSGPWPVRDVESVLADLEAQVAANELGRQQVIESLGRWDATALTSGMEALLQRGARAMRRSLARLPAETFSGIDHLDDGTPLQVRVEITGEQARLDFSGTGTPAQGNLRAPRAVVEASVLYVFRTLLGEDLSLNSGCLKPFNIFIPSGSLLDPGPDDAVAGGNVETSQLVVDLLMRTLGLMAGSQCTMNNLTFGDDSFGFYETIGGGGGAIGPLLHPGEEALRGVDCRHVHMTNTLISDVEVMETRYPVLVRRFARRRASGGAGRVSGGDGVVRHIEARRRLHFSLLSSRREFPPPGMQGGADGAVGCQFLVHRDGRLEVLPGRFEKILEAGMGVLIETPGGGAWDNQSPE